MSNSKLLPLILLCILAECVTSALGATRYARAEPRHKVRLQKSVLVTMRDGVKLSTDLYTPEGISEKLPVILIRTPYNKNPQRRAESDAYFFAGQGYLVAVQDVRGRWDSDGEWYSFRHEARDGYDTQEWLGVQPWCDGNVCAVGGSYVAKV